MFWKKERDDQIYKFDKIVGQINTFFEYWRKYSSILCARYLHNFHCFDMVFMMIASMCSGTVQEFLDAIFNPSFDAPVSFQFW